MILTKCPQCRTTAVTCDGVRHRCTSCDYVVSAHPSSERNPHDNVPTPPQAQGPSQAQGFTPDPTLVWQDEVHHWPDARPSVPALVGDGQARDGSTRLGSGGVTPGVPRTPGGLACGQPLAVGLTFAVALLLWLLY